MDSRRGNGGMATIIVTLTLLIVVGVWWIESRFGATMTGYVLVGLFGVICIVIGFILNLASTRNAMNSIVDYSRDTAQIEKYRQRAFHEFARGDSHERRAAAQIAVLDARRVDQLAAQRAKALIDAEHSRWELQRQAEDRRRLPAWADDDGDDTYSEWE